MVKLTVLYGHPEDPNAFEDYYENTHMPLAQKIPNVQRIDLGKVIATPDGSEPPYYRTADLWFENMDQLQSSMGSPEGQETAQDIPNFATGGCNALHIRGLTAGFPRINLSDNPPNWTAPWDKCSHVRSDL